MKQVSRLFPAFFMLALMALPMACDQVPEITVERASLLVHVVGSNVAIGTGTSGARQQDQIIGNEEWAQASQDPEHFLGSTVDLTGRVFYILGTYDGAFRFQMYTDPPSESVNTHVAVRGSAPALREGYAVRVVGTFKEIRTTTSQVGAELRLPVVEAQTVELLPPQTTPTAIALTATPTSLSRVEPRADPTPTPTTPPEPTKPAVPTPVATPQPSGSSGNACTEALIDLVVGNTGGDGVFIRRTPVMSDKIRAWSDGTRMIEVGTETASEGRTWKNVEDPSGNVGWVPSEYLILAVPPPASFFIWNTDQEGAYIRRTPQMADKVKAWPDGTRMEALGPYCLGEERRWKLVKDPDGNIGYVPIEYLW